MKHRGLGTWTWGLATRNLRLVPAAAFAALLLIASDADAQCAMCRRALASPEGQQMIAALRSGILVLLAAPFAVFGTIATLAVRAFAKSSVASHQSEVLSRRTPDVRRTTGDRD